MCVKWPTRRVQNAFIFFTPSLAWIHLSIHLWKLLTTKCFCDTRHDMLVLVRFGNLGSRESPRKDQIVNNDTCIIWRSVDGFSSTLSAARENSRHSLRMRSSKYLFKTDGMSGWCQVAPENLINKSRSDPIVQLTVYTVLSYKVFKNICSVSSDSNL